MTYTLVITLLILRGQSRSWVTLVESSSRSANLTPLPSRWPLIVEICVLRWNKHQSIDHGSSTEQAASHIGRVSAVFGSIRGGCQIISHRGDIVLGDGIVPSHSRSATSGVGRSLATFDEKNRFSSLGKTLSSDDSSRSCSSNDVIISGVCNVCSGGTCRVRSASCGGCG